MPLFVLPEYDGAGRQFFFDGVDALMRSKNPLFGSMSIETVNTLPANRITLASDQVIETAPFVVESSFAFSVSDTISGNLDTLYVALEDAAESGLASMMPQFFSSLSDICDAAGQTIDASATGISHDVLLDMIERIEITFNDDGSPNMPTLVISPELAERLRELPPETAEQQERFIQMMERKRREFFAGRRTRRLS